MDKKSSVSLKVGTIFKINIATEELGITWYGGYNINDPNIEFEVDEDKVEMYFDGIKDTESGYKAVKINKEDIKNGDIQYLILKRPIKISLEKLDTMEKINDYGMFGMLPNEVSAGRLDGIIINTSIEGI